VEWDPKYNHLLNTVKYGIHQSVVHLSPISSPPSQPWEPSSSARNGACLVRSTLGRMTWLRSSRSAMELDRPCHLPARNGACLVRSTLARMTWPRSSPLRHGARPPACSPYPTTPAALRSVMEPGHADCLRSATALRPPVAVSLAARMLTLRYHAGSSRIPPLYQPSALCSKHERGGGTYAVRVG
jgi:hypothetical protein